MVTIRPITQEDTPHIIAWRNNPGVLQNFIQQNLLDVKTHEHWLTQYVNTGKVAQFIIQADDADVGSVFLRDIDHVHKKAEFGIFIGEDGYTGKGIGGKATLKILEYGFDILNLNKIFLRVFSTNIVAIKSYEKAGFVREGYFKEDVCINHQFYDVIFMAILKKDWESL